MTQDTFYVAYVADNQPEIVLERGSEQAMRKHFADCKREALRTGEIVNDDKQARQATYRFRDIREDGTEGNEHGDIYTIKLRRT